MNVAKFLRTFFYRTTPVAASETWITRKLRGTNSTQTNLKDTVEVIERSYN